MEHLIQTINQLQDVCATCAVPLSLNLPQIVVVGTQSSGKSTLIESIVRREFLPKGEGIVTRRPLVIRLFKTNDNVERVKFHHTDREFTNFDEVRQEIERETERACGSSKGISAEPLPISIYSKNVVDLTLVDLPGLVRYALDDQPEDIGDQVRKLVTSYAENPNSIILAIHPADQDLAISEAMTVLRDIDPEKKRILVVLTKLDCMRQGSDVRGLLFGKSPIAAPRYGIISVVNRSQEDIINRKPIEQAIEDEAQFLRDHYPTIADRHGQPFLAKKLSQILMRHIRDCLPDLINRINSLISQQQAKLNFYGLPITGKDRARTIIDIIAKFVLSYNDTMNGGMRNLKYTPELNVGARTRHIFQSIFCQALETINPLEKLDYKAISAMVRNASGASSDNRETEVFHFLIKGQIKRLEDPSLQCVKLVHEELGKFVRDCGDELRHELLRFPVLREKIEGIFTKLLDESLNFTQEEVTKEFKCWSIIDTGNPRFVSELQNLTHNPALDDTKSLQNGTSNGNVTMIGGVMSDENYPRREKAIANKVQAYFNVIRDEVGILVPRKIQCWMLNEITSTLNSALVEGIYDEEDFDRLLSEPSDIVKRRKEAADMLATLRKASEIISSMAVHQ